MKRRGAKAEAEHRSHCSADIPAAQTREYHRTSHQAPGSTLEGKHSEAFCRPRRGDVGPLPWDLRSRSRGLSSHGA